MTLHDASKCHSRLSAIETLHGRINRETASWSVMASWSPVAIRPAGRARPTLQSRMDEQAKTPQVKPRRTPPSRRGKGPTSTSWKPGQSGNPKGRPRAGLAFAERVRERVDPDLVIDLAIRVAEDEKLDPRERLMALWPLIDRGFVKPPAGLDLSVTSAARADAAAWDDVPIEERRRLLADMRRARELHATGADGVGEGDSRLPEPSLPVDDAT